MKYIMQIAQRLKLWIQIKRSNHDPIFCFYFQWSKYSEQNYIELHFLQSEGRSKIHVKCTFLSLGCNHFVSNVAGLKPRSLRSFFTNLSQPEGSRSRVHDDFVATGKCDILQTHFKNKMKEMNKATHQLQYFQIWLTTKTKCTLFRRVYF